MSQFSGQGIKVRCVDCTKLSGNTCSAKKGVVSPKKRRVCTAYEFKGEYKNREVAEGVYLPPMDKKTRKMVQRLIQAGVVPVREDGSVAYRPDGTPMVKRSVGVPLTTATPASDTPPVFTQPATYEGIVEENDEPIIWTPDQSR